MRFKVGDVCVIVGLVLEDRYFEGKECTVVDQGCFLDREMVGGPMAWYLIAINGVSVRQYIHFSNLRLRRPPAWDKWLYDTSGVKHEQRDGVSA